MSFSEKSLWQILRRMPSLHFRKQAAIGDYIVDFVSHSDRLVVELDGGIHDRPEVAARDAGRDRWLVSRGYRVLRLPVSFVNGDAALVSARIEYELRADTPTPDPSPQGGGEE